MATIRYSTNTTTWTTVTPSGTNTNTTSGFTLANYASASVNGIANIGSIIGVTTNLGHVLRSNTSFDQFHYTNAIESGITWTTRTLPRAMGQRSIIFGQEVFLNDDITQNAILRSTNGVSWTTISSLPTTRIRMAYGNGLWLSVSTGTGSNSKAYSSTNAISWTTTTIPKTGTWDGSSRAVTAIAFGNGVFAAIGTSNGGTECTIKSTDGISWQVNAAATNSPTLYNNLYYGNGAWLAYAGAYNTAVVRSTDLVVWTSITTTLGTNWPRGFAYGNGIWVVGTFQSGDRFRRSTDGITWTTANSGLIKNDGTSTLVADTFYGDGKFIAVGWYGTRARSTDGISWVSNNQGLGGSTANTSIRFGNGIWVHSGDYGTAGPGGGGTIGLYTSEASQTFSSISQLSSNASATFALVSAGSLLTSTDMITFNSQNITWITANPIGTLGGWKYVYGNNTWVAQNDTIQAGSNVIYTSTDFITWTTRQAYLGSGFTSYAPIIYGDGKFVFGTSDEMNVNKQLRESTDGISWVTRVYTGSSFIDALGYGNGQWVANSQITNTTGFPPTPSTQYNDIMSSTDLVTWVTRDALLLNGLGSPAGKNAIAYGNGIWVIGFKQNYTTGGFMRRSTNLVTWTTVTSTFGSTNIHGIKYANDIWVAVGGSSQIRYSTDAITWVTANTIGNEDFEAIAYGDGIWLVGSHSGGMHSAIVQSTNGINWTTNTNFSLGFPNATFGFPHYENNLWIMSSNVNFIKVSVFPHSSSPAYLNKVVKSEDKYLYALNRGGVYVGTNGMTNLYPYKIPVNDNILNVAKKSNTYVAIGQNSIYRSTNLVVWTTISTPAASGISDIISI